MTIIKNRTRHNKNSVWYSDFLLLLVLLMLLLLGLNPGQIIELLLNISKWTGCQVLPTALSPFMLQVIALIPCHLP